MPVCPGKRVKTGYDCTSSVYKCKKCGNVGCFQNDTGTCSNEGFRNGKCLKCGSVGQHQQVSQ